MSDKKILIAYFSHSGNTKAAAEKIQKLQAAIYLRLPRKIHIRKNTMLLLIKENLKKKITFFLNLKITAIRLIMI